MAKHACFEFRALIVEFTVSDLISTQASLSLPMAIELDLLAIENRIHNRLPLRAGKSRAGVIKHNPCFRPAVY